MDEKVNWDSLYALGKGLLKLDNNIATEVFLNEKFNPKGYKKTNTFRALSISVSNSYHFNESIKLKEELDNLSVLEKEELIRLLIVQSAVEKNEYFNPVVLAVIDDNMFSLNENYLKVLDEIGNKFYFSAYASKLITKYNLNILTKSPEKIINSENFIFSNILNAITTLKADWNVDGLLEDKYNFDKKEKYLNGKRVINDLIDLLLEQDLSLKAIHEETLWISRYKEFIDEASIEDLQTLAKRIDTVIKTPIKDIKIYFLKNLLNSIDYYEASLKDSPEKVTYMLDKNIFEHLYVDNGGSITVDIDKFFKMQILTALSSVAEDNMSRHLLGDGNNIITKEYVEVKGIVESNFALYGIYCCDNIVLNKTILQEYFKQYNMNMALDCFRIEKEDRDSKCLIDEFIKEKNVQVDVLHLFNLKINLLNNLLQALEAKPVTFELKTTNRKYAVFNKEKNSHIDLKGVFNHLIFNRFNEEKDYVDYLEISAQHSLMKAESVLSKSKKGKMLKF